MLVVVNCEAAAVLTGTGTVEKRGDAGVDGEEEEAEEAAVGPTFFTEFARWHDREKKWQIVKTTS